MSDSFRAGAGSWRLGPGGWTPLEQASPQRPTLPFRLSPPQATPLGPWGSPPVASPPLASPPAGMQNRTLPVPGAPAAAAPPPPPRPPAPRAAARPAAAPAAGCNCKQSRCLKLYCICFAAGGICGAGCACADCANRSHDSDEVVAARGRSSKRASGVTSRGAAAGGCNCTKSKCQKRYCDCFAAGRGCSAACRCKSCANTFAFEEAVTGAEAEAEAREEAHLTAGPFRLPPPRPAPSSPPAARPRDPPRRAPQPPVTAARSRGGARRRAPPPADPAALFAAAAALEAGAAPPLPVARAAVGLMGLGTPTSSRLRPPAAGLLTTPLRLGGVTLGAAMTPLLLRGAGAAAAPFSPPITMAPPDFAYDDLAALFASPGGGPSARGGQEERAAAAAGAGPGAALSPGWNVPFYGLMHAAAGGVPRLAPAGAEAAAVAAGAAAAAALGPPPEPAARRGGSSRRTLHSVAFSEPGAAVGARAAEASTPPESEEAAPPRASQEAAAASQPARLSVDPGSPKWRKTGVKKIKTAGAAGGAEVLREYFKCAAAGCNARMSSSDGAAFSFSGAHACGLGASTPGAALRPGPPRLPITPATG